MPEEIDDLETRFPTVIPFTEIIVEDEQHEFRATDRDDGSTFVVDNYVLDKAPIESVDEITGTYSGSDYTFEKGTDYAVVDNDNDGRLDTIDWDVGGKRPDDNTEFYVTYRALPIIARYIDAFQSEFDDLDVKLDEAIESHDIDSATGKDLDEIGKLFGVLGKRRNRNDREYRAFLKSIVQSFKGRGTVDGIRFAVAAGLGVDVEEVEIVEDFSENEYRAVVYEYNGHSTDTVRDLADLADPSGISFETPISYILDPTSIIIDAEQTVTEDVVLLIGRNRLGSGRI